VRYNVYHTKSALRSRNLGARESLYIGAKCACDTPPRRTASLPELSLPEKAYETAIIYKRKRLKSLLTTSRQIFYLQVLLILSTTQAPQLLGRQCLAVLELLSLPTLSPLFFSFPFRSSFLESLYILALH